MLAPLGVLSSSNLAFAQVVVEVEVLYYRLGCKWKDIIGSLLIYHLLFTFRKMIDIDSKTRMKIIKDIFPLKTSFLWFSIYFHFFIYSLNLKEQANGVGQPDSFPKPVTDFLKLSILNNWNRN